MKILLLFERNKNSIIDELKKTESIEEVAMLLKPYRQRGVFIEIINKLLNEISELEGENRKLIERLNVEKEVEIL